MCRSIGMTDNQGYTWVIDGSFLFEDKKRAILANVSNLFIISVVEGVGPIYNQLLTQWKNPDYMKKYPAITNFECPPPGFMFYQTCLQILLTGISQVDIFIYLNRNISIIL
jgi:hypothetical protein